MERLFLQQYTYVIYTDVDEILTVKPNYKDLVDYINKNYPKKTMYSVGYEILTTKNHGPIGFGIPFLAQRQKWIRLKNFHKPVISAIPQLHLLDYKNPARADGDLVIIHLNRIDYNKSYEKYQMEKNYKWNPIDLKNTTGWQHRIKSDASFNRFFFTVRNVMSRPEPIPDWAKCII